MGNTIKKGILKRIGFDTYKDIYSLDDIKVRIVNSTTGVLIAGCETILSELPVDPAELEFKKAAITTNIVTGTYSIKVTPENALKFAIGDIVDITNDTVEVFKTTKISSVDYVAGTINLDSSAIIDCDILLNPKINLKNSTGTYTGKIQIPNEIGTFFVWISSIKAGKSYNYGLIEVVENDLEDAVSAIKEIKDLIKNNSSQVWGNIQI